MVLQPKNLVVYKIIQARAAMEAWATNVAYVQAFGKVGRVLGKALCTGALEGKTAVNKRQFLANLVVRQNSIALSLLCLLLSTALAQDLTIRDIQVVDPASKQIVRRDLYVHNGRVSSQPPPAPHRVIQGKGRYLLPGFIDTHTHSWGNPNPDGEDEAFGLHGTAQRMLFAGVTAFLDLGSPEEKILTARDNQRRNQPLEADLCAAGPVFMSDTNSVAGLQRSRRVANTPQEAEEQVAQLYRRRPDVIKIICDDSRQQPSLQPGVLAALVQAAHRRGLPAVAHITSWENARQALAAGVDVITHLNDEKVIPAEVAQQMSERGVWSIPTQSVQADFLHFADNPALLDTPLLKQTVSPTLWRGLREFDRNAPNLQESLKWRRDGHDLMNRSLLDLRTAGVRILSGSDSGNLGTIQGYSLHREMELLVEAGLTPWEALWSATVGPAQLLKIPQGCQPGCLANFVILPGDPSQRISATQEIEAVIFRGQVVDRAALKRAFLW